MLLCPLLEREREFPDYIMGPMKMETATNTPTSPAA